MRCSAFTGNRIPSASYLPFEDVIILLSGMAPRVKPSQSEEGQDGEKD